MDFPLPQQCNNQHNNPTACPMATSLEVKMPRTIPSNMAKIDNLRTLTDSSTVSPTVACRT
jgi:hypothetical protein